jgi:hypothetical protein
VPYSKATKSGGEVTAVGEPAGEIDVQFASRSGVTGIRISMLDSYATDKNFVLNELEVFSGKSKVPLKAAVAKASHASYPVANAINGNASSSTDGWAYSPISSTSPAVALFTLTTPGSVDLVRLFTVSPGLQLKRFKIETTTAASPTLTSTFSPVSISSIGKALDTSTKPITRFRSAISKAATLLSSPTWPYTRNVRTAAQTAIGLHAALPWLDANGVAAANSRLSEIRAHLRALQKSDGGWSDTSAVFAPQSFQSAQALRALFLIAGGVIDDSLANGARYLLLSQDVDGAWSSPPLEKRLAATTWVEIALPTLYQVLEEELRGKAIKDLVTEGRAADIVLRWGAVPDATSYNVYRRTDTGALTLLKKGAAAPYIDTAATKGTVYYYTVRWVDGSGFEYPDSNEASGTTLSAACGSNSPPVITSTPPTQAAPGTLYAYDVGARDADVGDTLTYSLPLKPQGMTIDASTGAVRWTPSQGQVGTHSVQVMVKDAQGRFATQSFAVQVTLIIPTPAPTPTPTPLATPTPTPTVTPSPTPTATPTPTFTPTVCPTYGMLPQPSLTPSAPLLPSIGGGTTPLTFDRVNWAATSRGGKVYFETHGGTVDAALTFTDEVPSDQTRSDIFSFLIDLGEKRTIDTLQFTFYASGYGYIVEHSLDNVTFLPLALRTDRLYYDEQLVKFPQTETRYVRVRPAKSSRTDFLVGLTDDISVAGLVQVQSPPTYAPVTLDGKVHGSLADPTKGQAVELSAGVYEIRHVGGAVQTSGAAGNTWEHRFNVRVGKKDYEFGWIHEKFSRFPTANDASSAGSANVYTIYVPIRSKAHFWIKDDPTDNTGGLTLSITKTSGATDSLLVRVRDAVPRSVAWQEREVAEWENWLHDS